MILPDSIETQFGWARRFQHRRGDVTNKYYKAPKSYRFQWIRAGSLAITYNDQRLEQGAGTFLLLPPAAPGTLIPTQALQDSETLVVGFRLLLFGSIDITRQFTRACVWLPTPLERTLLDSMMELCVRHTDAPTMAASFIRDGVLRTLVGLCWEPLGMARLTEGVASQLPKWLTQVMQEIRHHPEITVTEMERIAEYSHAHFHKIFQQYVGVSPRVYLQRYRVDLAKHLLTTTEMPIVAIAEHLGFVNASDFTRFFRRLCLVTPSDFRHAPGHDADPAS